MSFGDQMNNSKDFCSCINLQYWERAILYLWCKRMQINLKHLLHLLLAIPKSTPKLFKVKEIHLTATTIF